MSLLKLTMLTLAAILFAHCAAAQAAGPFGKNLIQNPGFDADASSPPSGWRLTRGDLARGVATSSAPSLSNVLGSNEEWDSVEQVVDLAAAGFTSEELDDTGRLVVVLEFTVFTTGQVGPQLNDNRFDAWVRFNNVSGENDGFIGLAASKGVIGNLTTDVQSGGAVFGSGSVIAPGAPTRFRWTFTNFPEGLRSVAVRLFLHNGITYMDDVSLRVMRTPPRDGEFTITNVFFDDPEATVSTGNHNQGQSFTPSINDGNFAGPLPETVLLRDMTFWGASRTDSQHDFRTPVYLNIYTSISTVPDPGPAAPVGFVGSSTNAIVFGPGPLKFEFDDLPLDAETKYYALFSTTAEDGAPINQGVLFEGGARRAAYTGGEFIHRGGVSTGNDMAFQATFGVE